MVSKCLFALTTLAVIGGVVAAQQCGTVTATYGNHRQVVREVVVKKEVVIPVIAPVAVYAVVPTYAAVYVPPVAAVAPAAVAPAHPQPVSEMSQVLQAIQGVHSKVDGLDARLKKLEAANDPDAPIPLPPANGPQLKPQPQAAAPAKPAGLTVLQGKCASCHEAAVAVNKGGGVTLFQGDQLAALSAQTKLDVLTSIHSSSMPKKGGGREPLTDAENDSVVNFIKSLK